MAETDKIITTAEYGTEGNKKTYHFGATFDHVFVSENNSWTLQKFYDYLKRFLESPLFEQYGDTVPAVDNINIWYDTALYPEGRKILYVDSLSDDGESEALSLSELDGTEEALFIDVNYTIPVGSDISADWGVDSIQLKLAWEEWATIVRPDGQEEVILADEGQETFSPVSFNLIYHKNNARNIVEIDLTNFKEQLEQNNRVILWENSTVTLFCDINIVA